MDASEAVLNLVKLKAYMFAIVHELAYGHRILDQRLKSLLWPLEIL
jgi:hypothetical protein